MHRLLLPLAAALLFLVSLLVRIPGLAERDLQPDEIHWVKRSSETVERLRYAPSQATTHLGQPGVTPALIMAASLKGYTWQQQTSLQEEPFFTKLLVARYAIAAVSSLLAPILLTFGWLLFGPAVGIAAGFAAALDPEHVDLSRLAHLDSTLTVTVTLTAGFYLLAVRYHSVFLKLLAGVFWGLSIATKPTAGFLVPALILYRAARRLLVPEVRSRKDGAIIAWSDVAAIGVGHLVFAALYTRLWHHPGEYLERLRIHSSAAEGVGQIGSFLQSGSVLSLVCIFAAALAAYLFYRRFRERENLLAVCSTLMCLLLAVLAVPQVIENLIRYPSWAAGLQGEVHRVGAGPVKEPLDYWWLFFTEAPIWLLLGSALSVIALALRIARGERGESLAALVFCGAAPVIWLLFLNVSDKQAWRYAIPCVPLLYLFTVGTVVGSFRSFARHGGVIAASALCVLQIAAFAIVYPRPELFFTTISGGLRGAVERDHGFLYVGTAELGEFLHGEASEGRGRELRVATTINDQPLKYHLRHHFPDDRIFFSYFPPESADFALVYRSHQYAVPKVVWDEALQGEPVFEHAVGGISLVELYRMPLPELSEPYFVQSAAIHSRTGALRDDNGRSFLLARPKFHKRGFLGYIDSIRVPGGLLELSIDITRPPKFSAQEGDPGKEAARVTFGSCVGRISVSDLSDGRDFTLRCPVRRGQRLYADLFWYGTEPVALWSMSLKRLGE